MHATDELAGGSDINQAPTPIRAVHRFLISFSEEMHSGGIRFGEIFKIRRIFPVLLIIQANGANILIAAPNGLLLAQPPSLSENIRRGRGRQQHHRGDHENCQKDSVPAVGSFVTRAAHFHAGLGSSMVSVARRPLLVSSSSTLLLPICISR